MKTTSGKIIYLDNNGTTKQCTSSINETVKWMKECSNPSTNNKLSLPSKKLIEDGKKYILRHCNTDESKYLCTFTSCGSESNIFIIKAITSAYRFYKKKKPHIVCSSIEHMSILSCLNNMHTLNEVDVTYILPNKLSQIEPANVEKGIKSNTCLIIIMASNNETGAINNLYSIGVIAQKHKIPFHTDCVQLFGKIKIDLSNELIGSLSVSFHKMYGNLGIGLLLLNKKIIEKYHLCDEHFDPLRGLKIGTPAVPAIAGAITAMKHNFQNRMQKNTQLLNMRNTLINELNKHIPIIYYDEWKRINRPITLVLFGPHREMLDQYMVNTLLISIVCNPAAIATHKFCNVEFKKFLEKHNIIVSIGSACNTHSSMASHVIKSLNTPQVIKQGVIRISLGDNNTMAEIHKFIKIFIEGIKKQCKVI